MRGKVGALPLVMPHAYSHHHGNTLVAKVVGLYIYETEWWQWYKRRGEGAMWATQRSHPILAVAMGDGLDPSWSSYCSIHTVLSPWWHPPERSGGDIYVCVCVCVWWGGLKRETKKGRKEEGRNRRSVSSQTHSAPRQHLTVSLPPRVIDPAGRGGRITASTPRFWKSYPGIYHV